MKFFKREINFSKEIGLSVGWKHAGLLSIWSRHTTIHFFPAREFWFWGKEADYYDGLRLIDIGFGPFVTICFGV